jgi:hypothetical protein
VYDKCAAQQYKKLLLSVGKSGIAKQNSSYHKRVGKDGSVTVRIKNCWVSPLNICALQALDRATYWHNFFCWQENIVFTWNIGR